MSKNLLGIFVFVAIALTACAQQKKTTKTQTKAKVVTNKTATASSAKETTKSLKAAPAIIAVRLERTPCFGKCPSYIAEVYSNGTAKYTSRMFTEREGIFEKRVGTAAAQALFKKFSDERVDTCSEKYELPIADLPGQHFTITYADKTEQRIQNAHFGPYFLKELGKAVDEIVNVDNTWKKTGEQPKQ